MKQDDGKFESSVGYESHSFLKIKKKYIQKHFLSSMDHAWNPNIEKAEARRVSSRWPGEESSNISLILSLLALKGKATDINYEDH